MTAAKRNTLTLAIASHLLCDGAGVRAVRTVGASGAGGGVGGGATRGAGVACAVGLAAGD